MKINLLLPAILSLFLATLAVAEDNTVPPPLELSTEQEHHRTMALLGIQSLRRGANGSDADAPNAANYNEALANPYPNLPDPLLSKGRIPVNTAEMWWQLRRPEIQEDFDREIYGRLPENVPGVSWRMEKSESRSIGSHAVIRKEITGVVDNADHPHIDVEIQAILVTPATTTAPVPVIIQFSGGRFLDYYQKSAQEEGSWQSLALARGWGYAYLDTASVQADNGAGLGRGIIGLSNQGQPRDIDDWGVLRAWAWGASQVLNYFESDKSVDARQVGVQGHSRWGKAALVAMAYDQRFAIAYISSSGAGGAKLHRRNWGELVENVAASSEYHWMSGNYLKYAGPLSWDDLPVDSHELITLCAPRPVFISAGDEGDEWVDARGMFMAAAAAQAVYELLGRKGMGTDSFPPLDTGLTKGDIAFYQHGEGHTDRPTWPVFLHFADRYLGHSQ